MRRKLIYTIGHSTHEAGKFVSLLQRHRVDLLIDVRSTPYSRRNPQFNRENLIETLQEHSIDYEFLGQELGARSEDSNCYENNRVSYKLLAITPVPFKSTYFIRKCFYPTVPSKRSVEGTVGFEERRQDSSISIWN